MTAQPTAPEGMDDFDAAVRYAIRHIDPIGFFRWLLGEAFLRTWKFIYWLDTQAVPFPGMPALRCDTVGAFQRRRGQGQPLALVVEFMSRTRTPTLRRLLKYTLQVQEDCPFQEKPRVEFTVLGGLVNLTGGPQSPTLKQKATATGDLGLNARFQVLTRCPQRRRSSCSKPSRRASKVAVCWCGRRCWSVATRRHSSSE